MDRAEKIAIEIARELTVSVISGSQVSLDPKGAQNVTDFFGEVYKNVLCIAKEATNTP